MMPAGLSVLIFLRIISESFFRFCAILFSSLPPETNIPRQQIDRWLVALREHMRESDFSRWAIKQYTCNGRHFLNHIVSRGIRLKAARPDDVEEYLRTQQQRYRRRHGHRPADEAEWRSRYTSSAHMLLRLAQGTWPPQTSLESRVQTFKETLQEEQLRPETIRQYLDQARLFLAYLDRQQLLLERATPQDLDGFIAERLENLSKAVRPFASPACALALRVHEGHPPASAWSTRAMAATFVRRSRPSAVSDPPDRARIGSELHPGLSVPRSVSLLTT